MTFSGVGSIYSNITYTASSLKTYTKDELFENDKSFSNVSDLLLRPNNMSDYLDYYLKYSTKIQITVESRENPYRFGYAKRFFW